MRHVSKMSGISGTFLHKKNPLFFLEKREKNTFFSLVLPSINSDINNRVTHCIQVLSLQSYQIVIFALIQSNLQTSQLAPLIPAYEYAWF